MKALKEYIVSLRIRSSKPIITLKKPRVWLSKGNMQYTDYIIELTSSNRYSIFNGGFHCFFFLNVHWKSYEIPYFFHYQSYKKISFAFVCQIWHNFFLEFCQRIRIQILNDYTSANGKSQNFQFHLIKYSHQRTKPHWTDELLNFS